jgi:Arc/MetJ family transcription regulator
VSVTSVDIDPDTLREAKAALGVTTTREAVDIALRDVVRRRRQLDAVETIASLDLEPSPARVEHIVD